MKSKKSIFLNVILFVVVFGLTIWSVFHGKDIGDLAECILECDTRWLIPAIICVLIYIWCESFVLFNMLDAYKIKIKKSICFLFSSIGFFFGCVTPSASGGQPMQVYYMKKEKIPVPVASVILVIVTVTYKLVLVALGIGTIIFANDFLVLYLDEALPVFYLGIVLNVICVVVMIMLLFDSVLIRKILLSVVQFLVKIHIVKNSEALNLRIEDAVVSYRDTSAFMVSHRFLILKTFFITVIQRVALFAVTCFVYKAFRLSGTSLFYILILQGLVAVSVDMLPLPGGMGISETLFMVIFEPIFGEMLLPGMILSRGIGYYGVLLISAVFTLISVLIFSIRSRNEVDEMNI